LSVGIGRHFEFWVCWTIYKIGCRANRVERYILYCELGRGGDISVSPDDDNIRCRTSASAAFGRSQGTFQPHLFGTSTSVHEIS
jgi:hypothetical protein